MSKRYNIFTEAQKSPLYWREVVGLQNNLIKHLQRAIMNAPCPRGLNTCKEFTTGCCEPPSNDGGVCWKREALEQGLEQ